MKYHVSVIVSWSRDTLFIKVSYRRDTITSVWFSPNCFTMSYKNYMKVTTLLCMNHIKQSMRFPYYYITSCNIENTCFFWKLSVGSWSVTQTGKKLYINKTHSNSGWLKRISSEAKKTLPWMVQNKTTLKNSVLLGYFVVKYGIWQCYRIHMNCICASLIPRGYKFYLCETKNYS